MRLIVVVVAVAFAAMFAPRAEAAGMFGEQDNFNTIQKITVSDALIAEYKLPAEWAGDKTELVSHTTTLFILAGVNITDKGYAIRIAGSDDYWDLTPDLTAGLQEVGVLPNPMPKYSIPVIDLVFGYSLWIVIVGLAVFYGAKTLLFPKKPVVEPPAADPPAAA